MRKVGNDCSNLCMCFSASAIGNGKVEKVEAGNVARDGQAGDNAEKVEAAPVESKKPKPKPVKKQEPAAQQKQDIPKPTPPILKHNDEKPKEESKQPAKIAKTATEVKTEIKKMDAGRARTVSSTALSLFCCITFCCFNIANNVKLGK